jgi:hypothetical protein
LVSPRGNNQQPSIANKREEQFKGFCRLGEESSNRNIKLLPQEALVGEFIDPTMEHGGSFLQFQRPTTASNMVQAAFCCIKECHLGVGKRLRHQKSRYTSTGANIHDPAIEIFLTRRKRRTHGRDVPGRVFPQVLYRRASQHAGASGRSPRRLKGGNLVVSQHPQQGQ